MAWCYKKKNRRRQENNGETKGSIITKPDFPSDLDDETTTSSQDGLVVWKSVIANHDTREDNNSEREGSITQPQREEVSFLSADDSSSSLSSQEDGLTVSLKSNTSQYFQLGVSSKAGRLKEKRLSIETGSARNLKQNKLSSAGAMATEEAEDPVSLKGSTSNKEGMARLIIRLKQVECKLTIKKYLLEMTQREHCENKRRRNENIQERAEVRLRLSQFKVARKYYEERLKVVETNAFPEFFTPPEPTNVGKVLTSLQLHRKQSSDDLEQYDCTQHTAPVDILRVLPPLQRDDFETLRDELDYEVAILRERFPDLMRYDAGGFAGFAADATTLQVGEQAPGFKLKGNNGEVVDSMKLLKSGPLIVTFYHGDWSSLCMITLKSMQTYLERFHAKGATLVAISPQSYAIKTVEKSGATFPLLSDEGSQLATQFRIKQYQMDADLPGQTEPWPLPMPATYVIDKDGTVLYAFADCDPTKRAEPADVLDALSVRKLTHDKKKLGSLSLRMRGCVLDALSVRKLTHDKKRLGSISLRKRGWLPIKKP